MNVLWFSWKDTKHPLAGGAETVSSQIMQRLVKDGHSVKLVTARYKGSLPEETIDGIRVYRVGGRFSVYFKAFRLYRKRLRNWHDVAIDEMNTIPFGLAFYIRKKPVLLAYQLARKIWFYQMPQPISSIGYIAEPVYLFLLSRAYKQVLTESESTKQDLSRYGFGRERTETFRVGISMEPVQELRAKKQPNTVLILGAVRPMKRTLDGIKAFETARDANRHINLKVAGNDSDKYADGVKKYISESRHSKDIEFMGPVSDSERLALMRETALILVTSTKEGWGLIVTEANSQGTPAIAYEVDGLRDSVIDRKTGILVNYRDTAQMAEEINGLLNNTQSYEDLRQAAWENSKQYTFDNCYKDFMAALNARI